MIDVSEMPKNSRESKFVVQRKLPGMDEGDPLIYTIGPSLGKKVYLIHQTEHILVFYVPFYFSDRPHRGVGIYHPSTLYVCEGGSNWFVPKYRIRGFKLMKPATQYAITLAEELEWEYNRSAEGDT